MSELDQIYQEFYAQVTAKIRADYEAFKKAETDYFPDELIQAFQKRLLHTGVDFSRSYEDPEIDKTNYSVIQFNRFREKLVELFRYNKKKIYRDNPVYNFIEKKLKQIAIETQYSFIIPSKETLAKTFAFYDAYIDVYEQLKIGLENQNNFSTMSAQQTLRQWLAEGKTEQVVDALQNIAERFGDQYFQRDVTHQAGRFNSVKNQYKAGLISDDFYNREINKIQQALQDLIDKVPANAVLEESVMPESSVKSEQPKPEKPIERQPLSPTRYIWISAVGLLLTVGLFAATIYFGNQMSSAQNDRAYYILLFPLAFAAGAFLFGAMRTYATWSGKVLNGSLEVGGPIVVAAGIIIGGFLLPSDNEPFEFTANLQQDRSLNLSSQYPKLENGVLQIWIQNKWEPAPINANNLADFKSIPGNLQDKKVPVQLQAKYWKLAQDSVTLSGKSQSLMVVPDDALGVVQGKVQSQDGSEFLSNVVVEIEGELDTTDARGNFSIQIPTDRQKTRYIYIAQKKGYITETEPFEFDGEAIEIRLRKQ